MKIEKVIPNIVVVFAIAFVLSLCTYGICAAGIDEESKFDMGGWLFFCIILIGGYFQELIKTKRSLEKAQFWDFHKKTLINALAESEVKSKTEIAKNLKKAGVAPKIIAETTGLTIDEIEKMN